MRRPPLSCFVWIYIHTVTTVSQKYQEFVLFFKQYLLGFFILEEQLAIILDRGFLFLRNTLLLHSLSHYRQTERLTKSQIHLLRVGWRNLFSSCAVVSFFFWQEISFGFTYSLCTQSTIQLWCYVSFWFCWEIVYVLHTYLVYQTVVQLCQFFLLWRES